MPASPARLKAAALLAAALALTLGIKFAVAGQGRPVDEARLVADLEARFVGQNYRVAVIDRRYQTDIVLARRGPCLTAARNGDQGSVLDDAFRRDMGPVGPVRYLYGGAVSDAAPRFWPQFWLTLQLALGRLGVASSREPLLAIAARPGCAPPAGMFAGLKVYLAS
jgi:hypothetical protein